MYQATDDSTNAGLAVFARESAPVCQAATVTTASRTPVTVPLHCSDPDGDAVTRSIVSGPAHGTLSAVDNSAGTVTYTPATEFSGKDSFTFAASDGVNQGAPATATITVTPGPLPTCGSASVRTAVGRPVTVPLRCSDADGDTVSRSIVSRPAHGALSPVNNAAGTVTYAPASGFIGSDTFTFSASDGVNRSAPATASLTVIRARLSRLHVSPSSFSLSGRKVKGRCVKPTRKNGHHQRCRRPISLRVSYTLNVADTVTLRIERQVAGRKVKGRCVKPTRGNGKHRKCNRFLRVRGKITLHGVPGANHFTFTGKIGGRRLGLGTYRLIATPAGGNTTKVIFKLVR